MARILFLLPLVLMASGVSAQQGQQDVCARDVARLCRAHMDADDHVVLACLKQHRARLSPACAKMLADHGQ